MYPELSFIRTASWHHHTDKGGDPDYPYVWGTLKTVAVVPAQYSLILPAIVAFYASPTVLFQRFKQLVSRPIIGEILKLTFECLSCFNQFVGTQETESAHIL